MPILTDHELKCMADTQVGAFASRGRILTYVPDTSDAYLNPVEKYTAGQTQYMGFEPHPPSREGLQRSEVPAQRATIRVAYTTVVNDQDRIHVQEIAGRPISLIFKVEGWVAEGYTAIVISATRLTELGDEEQWLQDKVV